MQRKLARRVHELRGAGMSIGDHTVADSRFRPNREGKMVRLIAVAWTATLLLAGGAGAQSFPSRTITLINPYAAGGPADLLARTIADGMSAALGTSVVVENRPGAGTAIGAAAVARAQPDGYTLFIGGAPSHIVAPALIKDAKYDGIKDFAPIATVANVPNVLVVPPDRPYKSVKELVAAAKANEGKMTFASVGVGSLPQFLGVVLQLRSGTKLVHVPYGGAAPASVDLLAGRIDLAFLNVPPVLDYIATGKLRALAVANGTRAERLPNVPTMAEEGYPDIAMSTWYGISAPARTPKDVIAKLEAAISKVVKSEATRQKLASQGAEVFYKGSADYAAHLQSEAKRMLELIEVAGMRPKS
ncbi:MAG TPA: tripartite tricarboxylate transporter substrate binding protein [Xanthobacteraceae bacterium]|nr:tripartite tricarboxylate transporter substrate binding protein [Xanthobacteraceae bacterium]